MASIEENSFVMGRTPNYAMTSDEEGFFVRGFTSRDTMTGLKKDSIVMGRSLLIVFVIEFIIGLGVYKYFQ